MESQDFIGINSKIEEPLAVHKPHPWHCLDVGSGEPDIVNPIIEIKIKDDDFNQLGKKSFFITFETPQA